MVWRKNINYLYYIFARCAPTNKMRINALKNIKYVMVGKDCYLGPSVTITPFGGGKNYSKNTLEKYLFLGDRVAVSPNVTFLCSEHPEKSVLSQLYGKIEPIVIDNDVWIGAGAIILSGVKVHKRSIVAAGAVVTKDVPENSVVAGIPAKIIKHLEFDDKNEKNISS